MAKDREKAKDPGPIVPARCNAIRKTGRRCKQAAGKGTPHLGRGPCKECAGSTPTVVKHYAREEAVEFAREHLLDEVSEDPLEAMLQAVRVAGAIVAYHRKRIELLETVTEEDVKALERANENRAHVASLAAKGGIEEKLLELTSREADRITLAAEAMFAILNPTLEQRLRALDAFKQALLPLEAPLVIDMPNGITATAT